MDPRFLLSCCEAVYDSPQITAGPRGRDGASLISARGCQVLVFRGTVTEGPATVSDWANDLHADLVTDPRFPGRVHRGFLSSITSLWPSLLGLQDTPTPGTPLYITGHSKGGALAYLAGWLLRTMQPTVVTFAAARVGDKEYAQHYRGTAYRFENGSDIVPRLPPFQYMPCGAAVFPPFWFVSPADYTAAHQLETGYKPWVM